MTPITLHSTYIAQANYFRNNTSHDALVLRINNVSWLTRIVTEMFFQRLIDSLWLYCRLAKREIHLFSLRCILTCAALFVDGRMCLSSVIAYYFDRSRIALDVDWSIIRLNIVGWIETSNMNELKRTSRTGLSHNTMGSVIASSPLRNGFAKGPPLFFETMVRTEIATRNDSNWLPYSCKPAVELDGM